MAALRLSSTLEVKSNAMIEDLERLKQRIPLLEYLQRHNWKLCRAGTRQEWVGLCPLHQETRPSFYVNAAKDLFYCHGCGRGGDLIRFVQFFLHLPFRQSVAHLEQELTEGYGHPHRTVASGLRLKQPRRVIQFNPCPLSRSPSFGTAFIISAISP